MLFFIGAAGHHCGGGGYETAVLTDASYGADATDIILIGPQYCTSITVHCLYASHRGILCFFKLDFFSFCLTLALLPRL